MTHHDRTTILKRRIATPSDADTGHYLTIVQGEEGGRRFEIGEGLVSIGRTAPCGIVLPDSEISRKHCSVALFAGEPMVVDEGSTNGTFVQGTRIAGATTLVHGALVQIGRHVLRYERLNRSEVAASQGLNRDLAEARRYLEALLPAPLAEGPMSTAWIYLPSTQLGGDGFGHHVNDDGTVSIYLLDVSGHGAGAAMHAVAVLNVLRRHALPGADFSRPDSVVSRLNTMFPMDDHNSMLFTLWYGVFDPVARTLDYCSAGHHPALLRAPGAADPVPLRTPGIAAGAMPEAQYRTERADVAPGAWLYLFSDGVFEVTTPDGVDWTFDDFRRLLAQPADALADEPKRLLHGVQAASRPGGFDDDFTLLVAAFR